MTLDCGDYFGQDNSLRAESHEVNIIIRSCSCGLCSTVSCKLLGNIQQRQTKVTDAANKSFTCSCRRGRQLLLTCACIQCSIWLRYLGTYIRMTVFTWTEKGHYCDYDVCMSRLWNIPFIFLFTCYRAQSDVCTCRCRKVLQDVFLRFRRIHVYLLSKYPTT